MLFCGRRRQRHVITNFQHDGLRRWHSGKRGPDSHEVDQWGPRVGGHCPLSRRRDGAPRAERAKKSEPRPAARWPAQNGVLKARAPRRLVLTVVFLTSLTLQSNNLNAGWLWQPHGRTPASKMEGSPGDDQKPQGEAPVPPAAPVETSATAKARVASQEVNNWY